METLLFWLDAQLVEQWLHRARGIVPASVQNRRVKKLWSGLRATNSTLWIDGSDG